MSEASKDQVLVLAPGGRDAALICASLNILEVSALEAENLSALAAALEAGTVGTAIITEESLHSATLPVLIKSVQDQPPWSDLPIIVLTRRGGVSAANKEIADLLGNVTTLERPFHPTTLIGAVRATLRSRARQRSAEALLVERDAAEAELRRLNDQLEKRVEERTAERELAVAQLHEARKLETLGQLTGGVAHDFNNLLTPIMGALDILQRKVATDERALRLTNGAMQSAERAKTLVARLLAFGRRQTLQAKPVDLAGLVEGMRDLIERSVGPSISITLNFPVGLPAVQVDPHQLELSLLNLAVNSRDAMPDGGRLRIGARFADENHLNPGTGRFVALTVSDSGQGMDKETLARAVEPFFTTKSVGHGTGLGLSMVHGLAAQSGGAFDLVSEIGRGTTASLLLPVAAEPVSLVRVFEKGTSTFRGTGTVLLVDDDELVRISVADTLREFGFTVVEAASASGALARLGEGLRPDVLVTDHMMPGMTGASLARLARRDLPNLPVLVITGYANFDRDESEGLDVLSKPFRQVDLGLRIAALMEREGIRQSSSTAQLLR